MRELRSKKKELVKARFFAVFLILLLSPAYIFAHSGEGINRYVASDGQDAGDCSNVVRPCNTLGYAASKMIKGDKLLVAKGQYEVNEASDLFRIVNAQSPVQGGYNRFDMYLNQSVEKNPTVLFGIPRQYAQQLEDQGFIIKSDIKFIFDSRYRAKISKMEELVKTLNQKKANVACQGGMAGVHACENVDLLAHIPLSAFSSTPTTVSDIWGFQDLNDGREYVLVGLRNGMAIFDVTDPVNPVEIDTISGGDSYWRDIKVIQLFNRDLASWEAYAYITADGSPDGVKVVDLRGLPANVAELNTIMTDALAHNVYISNTEYSTGVALNGRHPLMHITGSSASHGIRGYRLTDPANPALYAQASQFWSGRSDYVHDSSSFISAPGDCYENLNGCDIFIDFNEDAVRLWSVEDSANVRMYSSFFPNTPAYIHSGWVTEDNRYLFVHDELDEYYDIITNTEIEVYDISNLAAPVHAGTWVGPANVIEHNGYVRGNRYYVSHYESGLVILDISDPTSPVRVGYFDTFPASESNAFSGAWGVYPFLPSGVIAVSDINSGLYLLKNNTLASSQGVIAFSEENKNTVRGDTVDFAVARTGGSTGAVSVQYETIYASTDQNDITLATGILNWADGAVNTQTIQVPTVAGDQSAQDTFLVRLYNPQGGAALGHKNLGKATLWNNQLGLASFDAASSSVNENDGVITVSIARVSGFAGELNIQYQTVDGTAVSGEDYTAVSGTIRWAEFDVEAKTIEIALLDDNESEQTESFSIELVADDALLGSNKTYTVSIVDNDVSSSTGGNSASNSGGGGSGGGAMGVPALLSLLMLSIFMTPYKRRCC